MIKAFLIIYPVSLLIIKLVLICYFGYCYHLFSNYSMPASILGMSVLHDFIFLYLFQTLDQS